MSGGLPKGWVEALIDDVFYVTDYVANGSFASLRENVEYKKQKDYAVLVRLTDNTRKWNGDYVYVDKHAYDFLSKSKLFPNDIVMCNVGAPGQLFRVPDLGQPMTLGPNSILIRPLSKEILSSLIEAYFKSFTGIIAIKSLLSATAQSKFNKTGFRSLRFPLPPLNEQKRIVAKLDAIMPRIDVVKERLEKMPSMLKRFRQSVLTAAVTGKLTEKWREEHPEAESAEEMLSRIFSERIISASAPKQKQKIESIYSEIESGGNAQLPETWRYSNLNKVCKSFQYGTSAKSDAQGKVPVLRMGNLQNGKIDWSDLAYTSNVSEIKKYKLRKNSVLFNRTNSPELVGKTAIYEGEREAIFAGYLILIENLEELDSHYLNYALNTSYAKEFCYREKTDGVSQSNINAQKLAHFEIPLPPLDEQKEIVRQVDKLFALADKVEEHYQKARARVEALAQSVLAKAFRGELVPQNPDDEPAEKMLQRIQEEKTKMEAELKTAPRSARETRKNGAKTQRARHEEKQASEP